MVIWGFVVSASLGFFIQRTTSLASEELDTRCAQKTTPPPYSNFFIEHVCEISHPSPTCIRPRKHLSRIRGRSSKRSVSFCVRVKTIAVFTRPLSDGVPVFCVWRAFSIQLGEFA